MSFFGKSEKKKEPKAASVIIATGGCIDVMVMALCQHANDGTLKVKRTVAESLLDIGRKQPDLTISTITEYLRSNKKSSKEHRIALLTTLNKILEIHRSSISETLLEPMLELCMEDMLADKTVVADWQGAASTILVNLGLRWPDPVMDQLMNKFSPGTIPHYFIIFTLGDLITANSVALVPRLKTVLARVIPILGSIKHENLRWVFASAMYKFCDAVVNYVVNVKDQTGPEPITTHSFSGEIFPAYEIMFANWINSKEAKVRAVTIQAVGSMCAILTPQQYEVQLPRILQGVLGLYKKDKEHYPITMGLCVILNVGVKDENRVLEPHLNNLMSSLHTLACVTPDPEVQTSLDNNHELLRCFDILGKVFVDDVLHFLLGRLDPKISKTGHIRIGTLNILRHIVTRLVGDFMEDKKALLVSGLKPLCDSEKEIKVKKTAAQLIIAMAGHDYLSHEGGEHLVEFIVRNSAISEKDISEFNKLISAKNSKTKDLPNTTADTPDELRNMCDNILNLAATTIPCMEDVLWPFLLETVVPHELTGAVPIVSKCIAYLGNKKRNNNEEDYMFDFNEFVNIPKPPELVARLLVLLSTPLRRGQLGLYVLHALHAIGPIFDPAIGEMWDTTIPRLAKYLSSKTESESPNNNSNSNNWDNKAWEDLVLRLLSETIKVIDNDQWTTDCAIALCKQLDGYNNDPELKRACFKHLGLVLQKLSKKDFIKEKLNEMFEKVNHSDEMERQGCAQGFGYCSASHLDMVLDKVNLECKSGEKKSSGGGLFGFGASNSKQPHADSINTVMLCYGYIAAYSSPSLITTRIDVNVLNNMKTHMDSSKSDKIKQSVVKALDLIGKAMHPDHLGGPYKVKQRDELIQILINFMTDKKFVCSNQTIVLALNACSTFIHLEPKLPLDLETNLLSKIVNFYTVPLPKKKETSSKDKDIDIQNNNIIYEKDLKSIELIQNNLNEIYSSLLAMDKSITCLSRIISTIEPFLLSTDPLVRERASVSVLAILKKYVEFKTIENTEISEKEQSGSSSEESTKPATPKLIREKLFSKVGGFLAMICPRCTDSQPTVRQKAIESIGMMLYIDSFLRQSPESGLFVLDPPASLRPLNSLRERIIVPEINQQYGVVQELAGIIAEIISHEDVLEFLNRILPGLTDIELTAACGACVVLNGVIKKRGGELSNKIKDLINGLLDQMKKIKSEQTTNATLHAIRNLALHHKILVIDTLLDSSVPHSVEVIKAFQVIAKDDTLVLDLVDHLTNIMNNHLLMDEKTKGKFTPKPLPMSATSALGEIMETKELSKIIDQRYAQFFSTLMLRFGTTYSMSDAAKQAVTTLSQFIKCSKNEELETLLTSDKLKKLDGSHSDYYKIITEITATVAGTTLLNRHDDIVLIYEFLYPYLKGNYMGQRTIAASVLAELMNHTKNSDLIQNLLNAMMLSLYDPVIKLNCLIGIGNIASAGKIEVDRYAQTVLGALVATIDGEDQILAMESMNGLSKVFEVVDEKEVAPSLINLCHRIKPAFEKPDNEMRTAAFTLFGTLNRFGEHPTAALVFYEQIHNSLPCLLMHGNDSHLPVSDACKRALKRLSPLLKFKPLEEYLNGSATDDSSSRSMGSPTYDEFLDEISKLLIAGFPDKINYYIMTSIEFFKSSWTELRGNACTFVGYLLHHLPVDTRKFLNIQMITQALVVMLNEKDAEVRKRTAATLGLLYEY